MSLTPGQISSVTTEHGYILTVRCRGNSDYYKILEWLKLSNTTAAYADQKEQVVKFELLKEDISAFEKTVGINVGLRGI